VLDWANHETPGAPLQVGDVWSHALDGPGWTNRKIDPAGPDEYSYQNRSMTWNMHEFRARVLLILAGAGPAPAPGPTPLPPVLGPPAPPLEDELSTPASVLLRPGDLHNFVRGNDGALWHQWNPKGTWMWENLGGQLISSPSATVLNERIDVTGQGTDNALYHIWYTAATGWSAWERLDSMPWGA
jgi:hypothetical protein